MEIKVDRQDELVTIAPVGAVDGRAAIELEQTLLETARDGARYIVVDFSAVTLFAGAGIRVLIMLMHRLEVSEGRLILCALSPHVRNVLDVAGLSGHFTIVPTGADALARIAAAAEVDSGRSALARRIMRLLTIGEPRVSPATAPSADPIPKAGELARRVVRLLAEGFRQSDTMADRESRS
jgi:stage II sporulation protein AA (anti-sigma F factor antagonist)